jgi:hypothetical protein
MNVRSLKIAGAAAGLLFLVGAAPNVYAQSTQVLSMDNYWRTQTASSAVVPGFGSVFAFSGPLILTEVGFVTYTGVTPTFNYKINNGVLIPVTVSSTITDSYGVAWHTLLNPVEINTGDTVTLLNDDGTNLAAMSQNRDVAWTSTNPKVTYSGFGGVLPELTVGNIRVSPSNPSSNVAPEPGSIALLLTGGGALAGIALRRRRNAA